MSKAGREAKHYLNTEKRRATREWVERQPSQVDDTEEEDVESTAESSVVESSEGDIGTDTESDGDTLITTSLGTQIAPTEVSVSNITQSLKDLFNSVNSVQTVGNVRIENSTGVHIGNITNINGNIQIIQSGDVLPQQQRAKRRSKRKDSPNTTDVASKTRTSTKTTTTVEREERVSRDAFMDRIRFKIPKELCNIIPRHTWLAQLPFDDYDYMEEPVEYVVISHTATESSEKQAINIRIIRDIQCFHIESREWNDIAYNFLIGCDGNVYHGRGWGVVGAHTMGYNTRAMGISFIGCFMRVLPNEAALNACKSLLKRGVEEGHLAADYKLICHCQCRSTESPGRKLFEELQTWEHFHRIEE